MIKLIWSLFGWLWKKLVELKRRTILRRRPRNLSHLSTAIIIICIFGLYQLLPSSFNDLSGGQISAWRWYLVSERELAVYGAYLDYHDNPLSAKQVLVMAVLNKTETKPLYCHFITDYSRPKDVTTVGPIDYRHLGVRDYPEIGKVKLLECPLNDIKVNPVAVRVSGHVTLRNEDGQPLIPIYSIPKKTMKTVWCIGPLYDQYDEVQILVEQLEWAKLQGFDEVIAYVDDAHPQVMAVLRYYEQEGLVQVIDWNIAHLVNRNVYYLGQIALLNDCVYRNKHRAKYLFLHDIDERVISPYNIYIMNAVKLLFERPLTGAISMQSAFFQRAPPGSSILMHSHMKSAFYSHKVRSKLIVNPNWIGAADIHEMQRIIPPYETNYIDERNMFLAHFRSSTKKIEYSRDSSLPDYVRLMAPIVREKMKLLSSNSIT